MIKINPQIKASLFVISEKTVASSLYYYFKTKRGNNPEAMKWICVAVVIQSAFYCLGEYLESKQPKFYQSCNEFLTKQQNETSRAFLQLVCNVVLLFKDYPTLVAGFVKKDFINGLAAFILLDVILNSLLISIHDPSVHKMPNTKKQFIEYSSRSGSNVNENKHPDRPGSNEEVYQKSKLAKDPILSEMDYYKMLDVEKNFSSEELRKKYKKLCLKYHPDKNQKDPVATEAFQKVNEAYAVLSDPTKRKNYEIEKMREEFVIKLRIFIKNLVGIDI